MGVESRRRRPRAAICILATAAASACPSHSDAADRTFRTSLVGQYNPLNAQFGIATPNAYADFGVDGNLVGLGTIVSTGVAFFDIANPAAAVFKSYYNPSLTNGGHFQDVIIRGDYAFCAVDDSGSTNGGIHILNIAGLRNASPTAPVLASHITQAMGGFTRNHTITLDGDFLYAASNLTRQVKVFNVANPLAPSLVRTINTTSPNLSDHLHDTSVRNGRLYTSNITTGLLEIYDVSDVASPTWTEADRRVGSIPAGIGIRNHSNSVSEDGNLIAIAREDIGTKDNYDVQLWDITNPTAPVKRSSIFRTSVTPAIDAYTPHNPVIVGDTLYVSWYQAGMQVFNIRNPAAPVLIGAYDTYAGNETAPGQYLSFYDGNWGVNPVLGPKKVLVSDMDSGLFIVDVTPALSGTWTTANDTSAWQTAGNWDNGTAPMGPNGTDMIARFTDPAAGATRRVNISGGDPMRVGTIDFSAERSYTIAPDVGTSGRVEMNVTSGSAAINVRDTGSSHAGLNQFTADVEVSDSLVVTNDSVRTDGSLVFGNILATNKTITFKGNGFTRLTGANPWTGNLVIDGGRVQGAQSRLGAAGTPITIKNGGYLGFDAEGSSTAVLNAARVLHFESGIGRIECRGFPSALTVRADSPDQIRGGGELTASGAGVFSIGASNPNFTGTAVVSGGVLEFRHPAAVNHRPVTLRAGRLTLKAETNTDFASDVTVAPPEVADPFSLPSTTIHVDRVATGSGATMLLGDATVGLGLRLNVTGSNGYRLMLDSLTNAGRVDAAVPLTVSGPLVLNGGTGAPGPAQGLIAGAGNVFADGGLSVFGNASRIGPGLLRVTGPLTINPGAKLNMTTTDLLVDYTGTSPEDDIRALVRSGRDTGLGLTWTASGGDVVLAVVDNADWNRTSFGGVDIDASTIVAKYTYFGDSNLDGMVTGDDYLAVDSNLGVGSNWLDGDFNMDGAVTGDDYLAIDSNLGLGTGNPLALAGLKAEMVELHAAMFGPEYVAKLADVEKYGFAPVPEPSAGWVIGVAALSLRRRRVRG